MQDFVKKGKNLIILLGIVVIVAVTYWRLILGFFEQDEWAAFAIAIVYDHLTFIEKIRFLFAPITLFTHFTPVIMSFIIYSYLFLGSNYPYFATFVLLLHIINTLLVYKIVWRTTQIRLLGIAAAILFGLHNVSSQAVLWIAGAMGFQTAVFFFLTSGICYLKYTKGKSVRWLILSAILFILSLLCTESTLTLIVVYPFIFFSVSDHKISLQNLKKYTRKLRHLLVFPLSIVSLLLIKFILLQLNPHKHAAGFVFGTASQYPNMLLIKIFLYPLQALSQIADVTGKIFRTSPVFLASEYPGIAKEAYAIKISETIVPDLLYLFFSFPLLVLILGFVFFLWKKRLYRLAIIISSSLFMFFVSILPYIPLPKTIGFLENRYYYTPNLFFSIIVAAGLYAVVQVTRLTRDIKNVLFVIIIGMLAFVNFQQIQLQLDLRMQRASIRKQILSDIRHFIPKLGDKKNVFYVTGSGGDYFVEGLKIPFQSGFGNILMIEYYDQRFIDSRILDDGFLYPITSQGYREIGGSGFGYYFTKKQLQKDYNAKKFSLSDVRGYYWDGEKRKLLDITNKIRSDLEGVL